MNLVKIHIIFQSIFVLVIQSKTSGDLIRQERYILDDVDYVGLRDNVVVFGAAGFAFVKHSSTSIMESNVAKLVGVLFVIFSKYIIKRVTLNLLSGPVEVFKLFNSW